MRKAVIANFLVGTAVAHSWADNVGGGSYRGAQGGNDLIKQRYYCPFASLAQCATPASSGVVLTAENQRPCRTDFPTPTWGNAVAGEQMYVHWAGNGHTGSQGAGTCVSISIAPYSVDPDLSSFRQLASCLPYSHSGDITDAFVTIPADLPSGQYTVFWMWDFAPFWFSSCSDINVVGKTSPVTTAPTSKPVTPVPQTSLRTTVVPTIAPTAASSAAPSPTGSAAPSVVPVSGSDCKTFERPNAVCQSQYGSSSLCVSWVSDKCGRSQCSGAPAVDDSKC